MKVAKSNLGKLLNEFKIKNIFPGSISKQPVLIPYQIQFVRDLVSLNSLGFIQDYGTQFRSK